MKNNNLQNPHQEDRDSNPWQARELMIFEAELDEKVAPCAFAGERSLSI